MIRNFGIAPTMHRWTRASALATVAVTALLTMGLAPTSEAATDRADEHGINVENAEGERIWFGHARTAVETASQILSDLTSAHEDITAGVSLTSDLKMVEVYVTKHGKWLTGEMRRAVGRHFDQLVRVVTVEFSMDDLLRAQDSIPVDAWSSLGISTTSPSIESNGLTIRVETDTWKSLSTTEKRITLNPAAPRSASRSAPITELSALHLEVPVTLLEGTFDAAPAMRTNDSAPFSGGAEIRRGSTACSLGFPLSVDGKKYALTAGHCGLGTFRNGLKTVGSSFTTTWTGTTSTYGDWQLIKGSTYAMRVFNGTLSSSSSLPISRGNYGSRANGSSLCTSGRTTGQVCRFRIKSSHTTVRTYIDAEQTRTTNVKYVTEMISDPNDDGVGTCTGFRGGDSGGPAYYADSSSPGHVAVLGIVQSETASVLLKSGGKCSAARYYVSELKGVRAWNSSAKVG